MWFCELIWEVLRRLLEASFYMLCSSLDVLYGNMGLDCIRICLDFYLDIISGTQKYGDVFGCCELCDWNACVLVCLA